jgi:hypothetical protein
VFSTSHFESNRRFCSDSVSEPGLSLAHKEALSHDTRAERSSCRFVVAKTGEGKPVTKFELFHDTVSRLRSVRTLLDRMNERIVRDNRHSSTPKSFPWIMNLATLSISTIGSNSSTIKYVTMKEKE